MGNLSQYAIAQLRRELKGHLRNDSGAYPEAIERDFPHVLEKIAMLWGAPELDTYFNGLLIPDRAGRAGFPPDAAGEIFRLWRLHSSLGVTKEVGHGWSDLNDRDTYNYLDRRAS